MEGDADIFGLAELGHMEVVRFIGAAHVKRVLRAVGTHHAERGQELFLLVEIGGAQPPISEIGGFDDGHCGTSGKGAGRAAAARRTCCLVGARGASRSGSSGAPLAKSGFLAKGVARPRNWAGGSRVCCAERKSPGTRDASCVFASVWFQAAKGTRR